MANANNPIVNTNDGRVRGIIQKDYLGQNFFSFLGIPYAKAPIGELRFKAPVAGEPWEDVRDCTKEGPECPSAHMFFAYQIGAEDNCLNLNIYTKNLPTPETKLKPVMVWIHGGAFLYGSNKQELFGPHYLMTEDVVLVAINYRLGILGFLSLEDPSLGVPGNSAMKDMVMALKWVQANIANFNGDPKNVTIFGESAGAAAVHYLYISPMAKGLFHKAIAQSGCSLNPWARGESNAKYIAKALGYKETDEKKILDFLKSCSVEKLCKAQKKHPDNLFASTLRPFGPVIENPSNEPSFMPKHPLEMLKEGNFNDVPIIMGYTSGEGILFEIVRKVNPEAEIAVNLEDELYHEMDVPKGSEKSMALAAILKKFYFNDEEPSERLIDKVYLLKSDNQFVHGIHQSVAVQKQQCTSPIYLYRMSLVTPMNYYRNLAVSKNLNLIFLCIFCAFKFGNTRKMFLKLAASIPKRKVDGTCHGDDIGYLFTSFLTRNCSKNSIQGLGIQRFVKMWTNFAATGNPTPDDNDGLLNVTWTPVTKSENHFLDIGAELKTGTNPDAERMELWDSIIS